MTWEWVVLLSVIMTIVPAVLIALRLCPPKQDTISAADLRTDFATIWNEIQAHGKSIDELKKFVSETKLARSLRAQR